MRFFGLDVHLDFCEVAVADGGRVSRSVGSRVPRRRSGSSRPVSER